MVDMVQLELALVGTLLFSMFLITYVMMQGDSEWHENDCIGFLYRKLAGLMDFLSGERFLGAMEACVGPACCRRLEACQDYVFYQKNPIMPSMYVLFVASGFTVFALFAFPYIPFGEDHEWGISFYHKVNAFWLVGLCALVFYGNLTSDPGIITAANEQQEQLRYPMDNILYEKKECSTCKIARPARSKHCRTCGHCCARFDHHCPWINNCVGAGNIRLFLSFLALHVVRSSELGTGLVVNLVQQINL